MKEKVIYSRRIAVELRRLGFKVIRTDVNQKKPEFDIWFFEDTPELRVAFAKISNETQRRNKNERTEIISTTMERSF